MLTCVNTFVYCKRKLLNILIFFSESHYDRFIDHTRLVLSTLDVNIPYAILFSSVACSPSLLNS